jgi:capsular exopolysaccharide synthesis family protein
MRSISDILASYARRWPVFVVVVGAMLALAYLYLKVTPKTYQIEASLMVQDFKKVPEEKQALQELKLTNAGKLVENEIELLKSRRFIAQCVHDLGLAVRYKQPGTIVNPEVYSKRPFDFVALDERMGPDRQVEIQIVDAQSFVLRTADLPGKRYQFNQVYESDLGRWQMIRNKNLSKWTGKTLFVELLNPAQTATYYQKAIEVSLVNKQSPLVKLAIGDAFPQRGQAILNRLIDIYRAAAEVDKRRLTKNTLRFLDERLTSLGQDLTDSEKKISEFRSTKGLTDIASQSRLYLESAQGNQQQLNTINIQLNIVEGLGQYLRSHSNVQLAPATLGVTDPTLNSLIEKLSVLQVQREKLLAVTPEQSPAFEPLDRQLNATRAAINSTVANLKGALLQTQAKLLGYNSRNQGLLQNIPQQERELTVIKRQQSTKENLYVYLLQKREELSLSYASTLTEAQVIDPAYAVNVKWPKQSLVYTVALLLGLLLPASGLYLLEHTQTKVQSRKELETSLSERVFEEVTLCDGQDLSLDGRANNSILVEQLRHIRVRLSSLRERSATGSRVTLLTSSVAGEGKSFLARNLACVIAATGKKTVLVEFDMRRPSLAKVWQLPQASCNLDRYFAHGLPTDQVAAPSGKHELLDVVACHKPIANAADLLEGSDVDALIAYLSVTYDEVILDTPPVQLVADAAILARVVDVCLYVVRHQVTPKNALPKLLELQQTDAFRQLHVVYNGASLEKARLKQYQYYTAAG